MKKIKNTTITLRIGSISFGIETSEKSILERIKRHYRKFLSSTRPEFVIKVNFELLKKVPHAVVSSFSEIWSLRRDKTYFYLTLYNKATMRFDGNFKNVEYFTLDESGHDLCYLATEIFFSLLLNRKKGLLVHACGIDNCGKGYIFAAAGGGGKSTIASFFLNKGLLNDDRIILRNCRGKFQIFGNPWHGKVKKVSAGSPRLAGIFFLQKDTSNSIVKLRKKEAAVRLLNNTFYVSKKMQLPGVLKMCTDVTSSIPCYDLFFKKSPKR